MQYNFFIIYYYSFMTEKEDISSKIITSSNILDHISRIQKDLILDWDDFSKRASINDALCDALEWDDTLGGEINFEEIVKQLELTKKYSKYEGNKDILFIPYTVTQIWWMQELLISTHGLSRENITLLLRDSNVKISNLSSTELSIKSLDENLLRSLGYNQKRFKENWFNDLYQDLSESFTEKNYTKFIELLDTESWMEFRKKSLIIWAQLKNAAQNIINRQS